MITPCIQLCKIDSLTKKCAGCGRTLDEIARWSIMTENERITIMNKLKG
jgi:predicted Fe-S protein YdhL (DUF1289 family)